MAANTNSELCPNCGSFVRSLNNYTGWCQSCSTSDPYYQIEDFLARNADHLEHYILKGQSFEQALASMRNDVRPTCASCGEVLKYAPRNAVFCTKHEICRKSRARYSYLYKQKGLPKHQALALVLRELEQS